jgi:uncharacterized glyoxalase superfamily protein PhnB
MDHASAHRTRAEPGESTMDHTTFVPSLAYRDPKAALDWLAGAFDFELTMAIDGPDDDPSQCHYEMAYDGNGCIMIGGEWNEWMRSPASVGGTNTTSTHVTVARDIDAHCERARAAGATILVEPDDQFYGDRVYRCADLEGHHWTFAMRVREVSRAEAEAAIGQPIHATNWA